MLKYNNYLLPGNTETEFDTGAISLIFTTNNYGEWKIAPVVDDAINLSILWNI